MPRDYPETQRFEAYEITWRAEKGLRVSANLGLLQLVLR
jgi:hypothetical protein